MSTQGLTESHDDDYSCIFTAARLSVMGVDNLLNIRSNNKKKFYSVFEVLIINTN